MQLLEYLISTYEENEGLTADEILAEAIKQDPRYSRLNREESIELKRRFLIMSEILRSGAHTKREKKKDMQTRKISGSTSCPRSSQVTIY